MRASKVRRRVTLGVLVGAALSLGVTLAASCGGGESGTTTTGAGGSPGTTGAGGDTSAGGKGTGGSGGDDIIITDDGGTGSGEDADAACAVSTTEATLVPANILFIIDRSGSMNCNTPPLQSSAECELNPVTKDKGQPTKWSIVASALKAAIGKMSPTTSVGITYFNNDDYCGVQQEPDVPLGLVELSQAAMIGNSIDAVKPKGATPIIGGVTLGYGHMYYEQKNPGNDFIVLLTDGAETCAPDLMEKMITQTVPDALSVNIRTFVIGAPGSEPARAFLSRIAFAGGTAKDPNCKHDAMPADQGDCHFDMTDPNLDFATALNDALAKISGKALGCEFDVPQAVGEEVDYDQVNVTFTGGDGKSTDFLQDNKKVCDKGADGWQYNADKSKILLCGSACDLVKNDGMGKVSIALGCATQVAQ